MAAARFWRVISLRTHGGGDMVLSGWHWYSEGGSRLDSGALMSSSHTPVAGTLEALQDDDAGTAVQFAAEQLRAPGFWLQWDFGSAVELGYPRLRAAERAQFLGWGTLQSSADGQTWTTVVSFGRMVYPGEGQLTVADPTFLSAETVSQWDEVSKGSTTSIDGRKTSVWGNYNGKARTDAARTSGRRVFGLRLVEQVPPQLLFAGIAPLAGWSTYNAAKHWLFYGYDGYLYKYPEGSQVPLYLGLLTVGDTVYFDVDLDTGTMALRKNAGPWTAAVSLPGFVVGDKYIISFLSSSSSGNVVTAALLTTSDELGGVIPTGAKPWDVVGDATSQEPVQTYWAGQPAHTTLARDVEFGGAGRIWGTAETEIAPGSKVPTKARISLLRQRDRLLAREVWSDPVTGTWEVQGLDTAQQFIALAQDPSGTYRPVAADQTMPETTP